MPITLGLWRLDGDSYQRVEDAGMPSEERLEDLIESDPSVLGERLLVLGRQVITEHQKRIDILAVDGDGELHVLELKRNRTPRDVVAQVLDYGSWVATLGHDEVLELYKRQHPGHDLEADFAQLFDVDPPEQWNTAHHLTIVAAELDAETQRIVEYLAEQYGVPVNVVFFRYFADQGREYVARTWLIDQADEPRQRTATSSSAKTRAKWNGQDWYANFGDRPGGEGRDWEDARTYGFVSAGGGDWYSRTLKSLPVGATIWVNIPKTGYVGVGTVTGEAAPFEEAEVEQDGQPMKLSAQPLAGDYVHANGEPELVVAVDWTTTVPRERAVSMPGLFGNQNSACKLRNQFTLDKLHEAFEIE